MTARVFRRRATKAAPVLLLALLPGCKSWRPVTEAPAAWIARESPPEVRLTAATGEQVTIRRPIVVSDSIVSGSAPVTAQTFAPPRRGVRLADVHGFEVPRFDAVKTAGLAAGFLAVSITWARTVGQTGGGEETPEPPVVKFAPGFRFMWRVVP